MNKEAAAKAFRDALVEDDPVSLYERAPCGYLSTTPDGIIVKANQTFLTWLGFEDVDVVGRSFAGMLTAGGRIFHETHYAPMLRMQGHVREIAVDLVRSDGGRLPVLVNASVVTGADQQPRVVRVAVFDATERRDYERELVRAKERAELSEARALLLSQTLQQTLIPPALPTIPGLSLAADYHPAGDGSEVGGDFYDVFEIQGGRWCVVLGDVSGKGAQAAVVTALARYTIRTLAFAAEHVSEVLASLNDALCRQESERFLTVAVAFIEPDPETGGWRVLLGVAGHPAPLLVRADGATAHADVRSTIVGVFPDARFDEREILLVPGEALLLYSDGITEARGLHDLFGDDRLLQTAGDQGPDPQVLVPGLVRRVWEFQGGFASDDIAVLALAPAAAPRTPATAPSLQS